MKCMEMDLAQILKVSMLNKTHFVPPQQHITRYTDEYILYVVVGGSLCLEQDGEVLKLLPGDVCIFNKGEFQRPLETTECEFYYVHFEADRVREINLNEKEFCDAIKKRKAAFVKADIYGTGSYDNMKVVLKKKFHISDKSRLENIVRILKNNTITYGYNIPEWRINISNAVAGLMMRLEDICFENLDKGYRGKNGRVYTTVERIADYIENHYRENKGSAEIERDLLINFDYANRIFKKHIGYSIIKYRNRIRINTAKTLVNEKTLDDVAAEVGFKDRYYFSRCFKLFEGVSPERYREKIRRKKTIGKV